MSVLLCFSAIVLTLSLARKAQAQMPLYDEASRSYQKRVWQFDLQSTYYQATANYTKEGGQFTNLPSGDSYRLLDFDFGARWVPTRNWAIYGWTRVSNAESKDEINTRRNSTFTQVVLGTDMRIYSSKRFELIPDFSLTIPVERVDTEADEVLNREGALEANGRMIGRVHWGPLEPYAFAGFTFRDEGRSSLLPYGLGAETQVFKWTLGAELRGYQTVIKDKYTNDTTKRESIAPRNGGSLRYYSVDPSLLETNFWFRRHIDSSWNLKMGVGTSITGASTSAGWNVMAGLTYFFEPSGRTVNQPFHPVEETDDFHEETEDGVDQSLFQIQPPPPEAPSPVTEPEKQKTQQQQDWNSNEFQIELKHTKKKH